MEQIENYKAGDFVIVFSQKYAKKVVAKIIEVIVSHNFIVIYSL
jgi:hypothetical protein